MATGLQRSGDLRGGDDHRAQHHGQLIVRRLAAALLLVAGPLFATPAAASPFAAAGGDGCRDVAPCVKVIDVDNSFEPGNTTYVADAASTPFTNNPHDYLFSRSGGLSDGFNPQRTIHDVLGDAQIPVDEVRLIKISGTRASPSFLNREDVQVPSTSFAQEDVYPAVYLSSDSSSGQRMGYIRPIRYQGDSIAADEQSSETNGVLTIEVYTRGQRLQVTLTATGQKNANGTRTYTFSSTATSTDNANLPALTFMWDFGDGLSDSTPSGSVTHDYTPGDRVAQVTVSSDDGAYSGTAQTRIHFGSKVAGKKHDSPTGPARNPHGRQPGGRESGPGGNGQGPAGNGNASDQPTFGVPAAGGGATVTGSPAPTGRSSASGAPLPDGFVNVAGLELTAPSQAARQPAAARQAGRAATAPQARQTATTAFRISATLIGLLVVLLLLGLGVFAEARPTGWPRRHQQRRRRRGLHT